MHKPRPFREKNDFSFNIRDFVGSALKWNAMGNGKKMPHCNFALQILHSSSAPVWWLSAHG